MLHKRYQLILLVVSCIAAVFVQRQACAQMLVPIGPKVLVGFAGRATYAGHTKYCTDYNCVISLPFGSIPLASSWFDGSTSLNMSAGISADGHGIVAQSETMSEAVYTVNDVILAGYGFDAGTTLSFYVDVPLGTTGTVRANLNSMLTLSGAGASWINDGACVSSCASQGTSVNENYTVVAGPNNGVVDFNGKTYYYIASLRVFDSVGVRGDFGPSRAFASASGSLSIQFSEDIQLLPQNCQLQIEVLPQEILPKLPRGRPPWLLGEATKAIVMAHVSNCPEKNTVTVDFDLQAPEDGTADAGGHKPVHVGLRPVGDFLSDTGVWSCVAQLDVQGVGFCTVTYLPPEVSGAVTIIAKASGVQDTTKKVEVRVPHLKNFAAESNGLWRLTGKTPTHPDHHWGTEDTIQGIKSIAQDFWNLVGSYYGVTLGINDMSLSLGGLFDIAGDWLTPHHWHRIGASVDIDRCACGSWDKNRRICVVNSTCQVPVEVNKETIIWLCDIAGGWIVPEPQIHCQFRFPG